MGLVCACFKELLHPGCRHTVSWAGQGSLVSTTGKKLRPTSSEEYELALFCGLLGPGNGSLEVLCASRTDRLSYLLR